MKICEECLWLHSYSIELHRSSHRRYSKKTGVLKNFSKLTGKHLGQSLFFNKVAGLSPATWYRCFPVNFAKFLRATILKNICERLLLVAGWRTTHKLSPRDLPLLTCLVYINISVASSFPSFIYDFFMHFCFIHFCFNKTKLTKGKLCRELRPVLKYNFKERDWIFRQRRQIWSCGICRLRFLTYWVILKMTKTGYNILNSKSNLRLHNFREV